MTMTTLLVGSHFRPPAKLVLSVLPQGTKLELESEPDNPYDPNAIRVYVATSAIPISQYDKLEEDLPGTGHTLQELLAEPRVWLGYLASADGKPLAAAREIEPGLSSNSDFAGITEAMLIFGIMGDPRVHMTG